MNDRIRPRYRTVMVSTASAYLESASQRGFSVYGDSSANGGENIPEYAFCMTTEYRRSEYFVHRNLAGENMLVALRRNDTTPLFALSSTGAALWERLGDWSTIGALAASLVESFDVSIAQAETDTIYFTEQLLLIDAVHRRESNG